MSGASQRPPLGPSTAKGIGGQVQSPCKLPDLRPALLPSSFPPNTRTEAGADFHRLETAGRLPSLVLTFASLSLPLLKPLGAQSLARSPSWNPLLLPMPGPIPGRFAGRPGESGESSESSLSLLS